MLAQSNKVISTKLSESGDIIAYIESQSKLMSAIEEFFPGESVQTKIHVALLHMSEKIRSDADYVYEDMKVRDSSGSLDIVA